MKNIFITAVLLYSSNLFAHGEDKPGPHGGKIEMVKNVHIEVNADKDGSFHIFLLDGNIENPTVKNSSLDALIKSSDKEINLSCSVMGGTHFHCQSKVLRPTDGTLILKAKRDTVEVEAKYDLAAFKDLTKNKDSQKKHVHHHH